MNIQMLTIAAVAVVFAGSIFGIFKTKTVGFGRYTSSVLILTLVLFVAAMAFALDQVEWEPMANLLFAVAGFAGGLIVSEKSQVS